MKLFKAAGVFGILVLAASISSAFAEPMTELAVYNSSFGKFSCDSKETGSGKSTVNLFSHILGAPVAEFFVIRK